jgi:O-antigen/teichoic acid export membrane protein
MSGEDKKGTLTLVGATVTGKILEFCANIILARILFPRDFGLFCIISAVTGLIALFGNVGVGNFLLHKQEKIGAYATAAFWMNICLGAAITAGCFLSAPLTARIFQAPALEKLQMALSLIYLLAASGAVPQALMQKRLAFGRIGWIHIVTAAAGFLLTTVLALKGFGVWSFVIPAIFTAGLQSLLFFMISGWRPEAAMHFGLWRDIFRYGKHIFGADLNTYLLLHLDFLIIGKFLGIEILGLYKFAFSLATALSVIFIEATARIVTPSLALLQDRKDAMHRAVLRILGIIGLLGFPLFLGLLISADAFIPAIYGEKWLAAVLPFQIFTLLALSGVIGKPATSLLNAIGKPQVRYRYSLVFIPVTIAAVLLSLPAGLPGVSIAYTVCVGLLSLLVLRRSLKLIGLRSADAAGKLFSSAAAAGIMVICCAALKYVWPFAKGGSFPYLMAIVAAGIICYALLRLTLFREETMAYYNDIRGRSQNPDSGAVYWK